jgi:RHS repeat-associated protein
MSDSEMRDNGMDTMRKLPLIVALFLCPAALLAQDVQYYHLDAIGNVRAVTDQSGAIVERHDYLPFGEECTTGACASNPGLAGGQPKHFTGKERDVETGLDYFGARYYGSATGRFTTVDPVRMSVALSRPQTWNRYAYALNNPLSVTDPFGLWNWAPSAGGTFTDDDLGRQKGGDAALKFRQRFRAGLGAARGAEESSSLSQDQQSAVRAAVDAYGTEGDFNGVSVGSQAGYGGSTVDLAVGIGADARGSTLATTIAHEGAHLAQYKTWLSGGQGPVGDLNHFERETGGWRVSSFVAQALGMKSLRPHGGGGEMAVWNSGWRAGDIETLREKGIAAILSYMNDKNPGSMGTTFTSERRVGP